MSDSDFTIVRYSAQILEQRVLTLVSFPPSLVFFRTIVRFYPGRKFPEEPNLERTIVRSNQLGLPGDYEQKNPRKCVGFVEVKIKLKS